MEFMANKPLFSRPLMVGISPNMVLYALTSSHELGEVCGPARLCILSLSAAEAAAK